MKTKILNAIVSVTSVAVIAMLLLVNAFGMMKLINVMRAICLVWFAVMSYYIGYNGGVRDSDAKWTEYTLNRFRR